MWPFRRKATAEGPARSAADLGRRGEKLARRRLKRGGLTILATNYRCPAGEVDLIALDPSTKADAGAETLVFVEVKTRGSDRYTDPASAVDADKQRRMRRVAKYYLSRRDAGEMPVRFDVVSILIEPGQEPHIDHIPGAFP